MTDLGEGTPLTRVDPLSRTREMGRFKSVELNAAGWSALTASGLTAGAALSRLTVIPPVGALVAGVLGAWGVARVIDHRRWRELPIGIGRGELSEDPLRRVIDVLQAQGVTATYRETIDEDSGEIQRGLRCRQADRDVVSRALEQAAQA